MAASPCFLCLISLLFHARIGLAQQSSVPADQGDSSSSSNSSTPPLPGEVARLLDRISSDVSDFVYKHYGFCINDVMTEAGNTFNFGAAAVDIMECNKHGRLADYLCMSSELQVYFTTDPRRTPRENINCNPGSYLVGCNPGFASPLAHLPPEINKLGRHDYPDRLPRRTSKYRPCCDGFFCPKGLACMIPCPTGATCLKGNLNQGDYTTCDPYDYGPPNATIGCGGADKWGIAGMQDALFCPPGRYCPTPSSGPVPCDEGMFCRKGSSEGTPCSPMVTCNVGTDTQDLHFFGVLVIVLLLVLLILVHKGAGTVLKWHGRQVERRRARAAQEAASPPKSPPARRPGAVHPIAPREAAACLGGRSAPQLRRRRSSGAADPLLPPGASSEPDTPTDSDSLPSSTMEPGSCATAAGPTTGYNPPVLDEPILAAGPLLGNTIALQNFADDKGEAKQPPAAKALPLPARSDYQYVYEQLKREKESEQHNGLQQHLPHYTRRQNQEEQQPLPTPPPLSLILSQPQQCRPQQEIEPQLSMAQQQLQVQHRQEAPPCREPRELRQVTRALLPQGLLVRQVPPIELEFQELGLTLKRNGKRILHGVSGKLRPGRVAAVMGPSGAGKTMFLTAVAGKETYSYTTGRVLINGNESCIQSYRRIVGFVPQDDIVHGNLTVEENLWFSASYRLPAKMQQRDRIFAVERAIWALGLESIRNSRVGTVEKRGISGGQRKRVNVGLEMVMEPSLLILDEPTSGLDSTSSRLVVQALRREASRGVNVGVVLHQPSYRIFCMFDDVMFLAKGGRTVYLGPVAEVEGYFDKLGFPVPARINPPDHYMDVLEGIIQPDGRPGFNTDDLPGIWKRHARGRQLAESSSSRPVPQEAAIKSLEPPVIRMSVSDSGATEWEDDVDEELKGGGRPPRTVIGKLWSKLWHSVGQETEEVVDFLFPPRDLSGRVTPGFWRQYVAILRRAFRQRLRDARLTLQDYIILLITGAALGFLSSTNDDQLGGFGPYTNTTLALALLSMIAALRTFHFDMLTYFREAAAGINRVSYFLAKDTIDLFNVALKPLFYLGMFYFFNNPRSTFHENYGITLALMYATTGVAYVFAITLQASAAQLTSAVFTLVSVLLGSRPRPPNGLILALYQLSFARWAMEGYMVANAHRYNGVWLLTRCAVLGKMSYDLSHYAQSIAVLVAFGVCFRVLALACLFAFHRDQQR